MIFLCGIHGSGKSYLCSKICKLIPIKYYTASDIIRKYQGEVYENCKYISDVEANQQILIQGVSILNNTEQYILDGHFCLLNNQKQITRVPLYVFQQLNPQLIIIKMSEPEVIRNRLLIRDNCTYSLELIDKFQAEEFQYACEIAKTLGVKIVVITDDTTIDFIIDKIGRI